MRFFISGQLSTRNDLRNSIRFASYIKQENTYSYIILLVYCQLVLFVTYYLHM